MKVDDLFTTALNHWRDNKGIGTAIIPRPLHDADIIVSLLQKVYSSYSSQHTVIIASDYANKCAIKAALTSGNSEENNEEFRKLFRYKTIEVVREGQIKNGDIKDKPFLCIWYRPAKIDLDVKEFMLNSKFRLIVLNKIVPSSIFMYFIYKLAPLLEDFNPQQVERIRLSTPVEEYQVGVTIPKDSKDAKALKDCTEYISASLSIFGSFDIMNQANMGNHQLNISATQICNKIAQENGWNDHLDMSIEFNRQIDELYNPVSLNERASQTYEIIRDRNKILSDYSGKLDTILDILRENEGKKTLIINKRAEFASEVTAHINSLSDHPICMDYHDKLDPIPAVDDFGKPVFYKTGSKRGERKLIGSQAQKTLSTTLFNNGVINILSTSNAPDKRLNIDVDVVIITSPMCEDISSYIYRLSDVTFRTGKIKLYTIYCRDTPEQKLMENKTLAINHSVKNHFSDDDFPEFVVVD